MIDLLIKYPTRQRPEIFKRVISDYISKLSGKRKVKFIISIDNNDATCNNQEFRQFLESLKTRVDLEYFFGDSKNKIDACNRNVPADDWRVCLLVSDDMLPRQHGFDDIIIKDMETNFPDFDGCLNYNCGGHAFPKVMVLSVIGNPYYKRFNYIYHPDYVSLFCDEEQTVIARSLHKIVDINKKIITHDWNDIKDDLRKHTESFYQSDKQIFELRKQKGFPI
jgi:hypothetical protein